MLGASCYTRSTQVVGGRGMCRPSCMTVRESRSFPQHSPPAQLSKLHNWQFDYNRICYDVAEKSRVSWIPQTVQSVNGNMKNPTIESEWGNWPLKLSKRFNPIILFCVFILHNYVYIIIIWLFCNGADKTLFVKAQTHIVVFC